MSSVWRALPFLSTPKASPLLPLDLSRLLLTSTGLSYFTRLSTGGIILRAQDVRCRPPVCEQRLRNRCIGPLRTATPRIHRTTNKKRSAAFCFEEEEERV
jgi:hypothetical protein